MKPILLTPLLALFLPVALLHAQDAPSTPAGKGDPFLLKKEETPGGLGKPAESKSRAISKQAQELVAGKTLPAKPQRTLEEAVATAVTSRPRVPGMADNRTLDIGTALDLYEDLTGKIVIRPNQVLLGMVFLDTAAWVSKEEAILALGKTLAVNGFTLIPDGDRFVTAYGNGISPRIHGLPVLTRLEELPDSHQVATFVLKLRNRNAKEIAALVTALIVPSPAQYTSVVPDEASGTLVITETAGVLRPLVTLLQSMDVEAKSTSATEPSKSQ